MEGIKVSKKPKLKSPYLLIAWPGMGEVAFKAVSYLIGELKAEEIAEIPPEEFFYFTGSVAEKGLLAVPQLPYSKFYYWKDKNLKHDLLIFLSNAQPDLAKAEQYCKRIIAFAKSLNVKKVIGFAAMPQAIDHTQAAGVWATATSQALLNEIKKYDFQILNDGQISGMNGLFLGIAKKTGLDGICLLGGIPLYTIQVENPKASYAVLEAFIKMTDIRIELAELLGQAHAMEAEIGRLLDYLKVGAPPSPIGDDEIERIKRSLSQLTKLPASVKEKIEKLFQDAKTDISKASQLKLELDHWNVYKDYEDRFLDLFKKSPDKDKSN